MKIFKICILISVCLLILSGCGNSLEKASEQAEAAYTNFLSGDISLFDSTEKEKWALDVWTDTILPSGGLEYTYLDLDGDGVSELLVQYADDPCTYNGVFHYSGGKLFCWQNDFSDGSCRDYPLKDGKMVRQYDFNGTCTYTIFRYKTDGKIEELSRLFAREELIPEDSENPCPYYEVDGEETDKTVFYEKLNEMIINQMLERSAWTSID